MNYNSKHDLSFGEKLLYPLTLTLSNIKYKSVKRHYPEAFVTVREICRFAEVDLSSFDKNAREKLNDKVSGIYRAGSRFIKDCICVQLYEDADEIMQWAINHGAIVCVTRKKIDGIPCIVVNNTAEVYAKMCSYFRIKSTIPATAIAGSIGKTTTKKMIKCVYETQYNVFCDAGNDNQIDGVGYISQHIPARAEKWIQEVSEDTQGCMSSISEIVRPEIAVVTAIDKSHIEEYSGEQGILNEIHSITDAMDSNANIITSCDEENTKSLFIDKQVIFVSMKNTEADYYASNVVIERDGLHFCICEKSTRLIHSIVLRNVYAVHNVYAALMAFAAGVISGVSRENIVKGLHNYRASGIRQNVYEARGITVYADCYNAASKSIRSAVEACDSIPVEGRRIAVIGDVEEAGEYSKEIHKEIVKIVNDSKFDILITFGPKTKEAVDISNVRESLTVCSFIKNKKDLNKYLKTVARKKDLVLFKASHKSRLDQCIASVFPVAFVRNTVDYYWPQITWRFDIINSWTL